MSHDPVDIYNEAYRYYTASNGYPLNRRKAIELFHQAAELGNSHSMNYLGIIYEEGEHVPQDLEAAANWFYKAYQADATNVHAINNLGRFFFHGIGVGKDLEKAIILFSKVANAGPGECPSVYASCCNYLGSILFHEYQDHAKAYYYFVKAAKYGDSPEAWYTLGWYSEQGFLPSGYNDPDGSIVSSANACYRRSAQQGYAPAQHSYGVKLLSANQTELGTKYITKAADQGYEPAIKTLRILNAGNISLSGMSKNLFKKFIDNF